MKRLIALLLSIVMVLTLSTTVFAKPGDKENQDETVVETVKRPGNGNNKPGNKPGNNKEDDEKYVEYYISRWGVQWDSEGDVQSRDVGHFSSMVAETTLTEALDLNFAVVIGSKNTEEDILSYVLEVPNDDDVFAALKKEFAKAQIYSSKGKLISWDDFTSEKYATEWYVLKREYNAWHIDGRLIEIETNENVNIVLPEEKEEFAEVVGPEEAPKEEPTAEPTTEPTLAPTAEPTIAPTAEPTVEPEPEVDESIDLTGATYAYIFGYEPIITELVDEEGNRYTTAQIEMAMDDAVTVEQVSSMLMRMLDQSGNTMHKEYPITAAVEPHRGQWYERGLAYLCSVGGFDEDETIAIAPITRGQVAKLVACALKLNLSSETPFKDIEGNKYKEYIEKVYRYGYMKGVSKTEFDPNRVMTRAEFCSLFNNIIDRNSFGLIALDEEGNEIEVTAETYYFIDMNPSHWAYEICLKASSAYDDDGYVDLVTRNANIRNILDKYDAQKEY